MNTEYEVRILEINFDQIKKKLEQLKAKHIGDYEQKRYVYDVKPKRDGKWVRLRTNGTTTTLTIKDITSAKIDGTKELEIEVDDFDKTNMILEELGYTPKGVQENKRIQYVLDNVEIDIDTWPNIPTYMEIVGQSEEDIHKTVEKLGFSMKDATTLDVEGVYFRYGYTKDDLKELKFEEEK